MENKQNYLPLSERTGKLPYTLQNDYLFKVVMESDEKILRSLLCSLLHLEEEEISSVTIVNPIIPGKAINMKTVILDIQVVLNDNRIIDLEMQRQNREDWPERSLTYLCRIFNNVKKGDSSYLGVMPAHHIGILGFDLPHLSREFYSHFYMMNPKTYEIYSDKLCLSVLNLNCRELATEEDKRYGLDKWADLFLADTWEDFQMLANHNTKYQEVTKEVADAIYRALADARQREALERYEERKAEEEWMRKTIQEQGKAIEEKDTVIQEKDIALQEKDTVIQEKDIALEEKDTAIREQGAALKEKDNLIAELKKALAEQGGV